MKANTEAKRDRREYQRRYYEANRDRMREASLRNHHANRDEKNEAKRRYWAANRDKMHDAARRYREAHSDEEREVSLRYREANRDREAERTRRWRIANPDKKRQNDASRRARKRSAFVETVDPIVVFERDNWICHICKKKVDRKLKYPSPRSVQLDHIVPLAKGGLHCYANCATTHKRCNNRKHAKIPHTGIQLRLL
jgi:5-methylcytosine-specific restriction endonuclease McrA